MTAMKTTNPELYCRLTLGPGVPVRVNHEEEKGIWEGGEIVTIDEDGATVRLFGDGQVVNVEWHEVQVRPHRLRRDLTIGPHAD